MKRLSKIPLYLFAKAPVAGLAKKRLCPPLDQAQAAQVATALLVHAIETVEKHWPGQCVLSAAPDLNHAAFSPVIQSKQWKTTVQPKVDLGERMRVALVQGVALAGQAAVLGTDIPSINRAILRCAHQSLAHGQQVVGPSADGGFYFLGLHDFPRHLFRGINWGTNEVFGKLMENAEDAGLKLQPLPLLSDCDYFADLQMAAADVPAFSRQLEQAGFDLAQLSRR